MISFPDIERACTKLAMQYGVSNFLVYLDKTRYGIVASDAAALAGYGLNPVKSQHQGCFALGFPFGHCVVKVTDQLPEVFFVEAWNKGPKDRVALNVLTEFNKAPGFHIQSAPLPIPYGVLGKPEVAAHPAPTPAIRCECGGEKTGTGHSHWCPRSGA